jgi:hypothetical protein
MGAFPWGGLRGVSGRDEALQPRMAQNARKSNPEQGVGLRPPKSCDGGVGQIGDGPAWGGGEAECICGSMNGRGSSMGSSFNRKWHWGRINEHASRNACGTWTYRRFKLLRTDKSLSASGAISEWEYLGVGENNGQVGFPVC